MYALCRSARCSAPPDLPLPPPPPLPLALLHPTAATHLHPTPPLQRCSDGTECTGSVDGGSPCTEGQSWKRERCHGRWDDRGCCDSKHYCHGGHKVRCPENTKCWGSDDGEQPCKHHRPKPDGCGDECNSDDWDKVGVGA